MSTKPDWLRRGERIIEDDAEAAKLLRDGRRFRRVKGCRVLMSVAETRRLEKDEAKRIERRDQERAEIADTNAKADAILDGIAARYSITRDELVSAIKRALEL